MFDCVLQTRAARKRHGADAARRMTLKNAKYEHALRR
jgi:queuine/archaeosine tRNA-ribosyltransferase